MNIKYKLPNHAYRWLLTYLILHLLIRLLFSQTLQLDDAEQIRQAQDILLGYPIPQPPLYSWLSWGIFKIFGTGLFAITLLKYILITLTFWVTWSVSGQLFQHSQTRYLATFSYLLMPSFAWHMHQGFTHTILLGLGIIISLHALLSLKNNPTIKNYLYFGFALGVGLMGKYSFLLFMFPLLISTFSITSFRKIVFDRKILLSIGIFALILGPHVYWLTQHYQEIFISIDQKLKITSDNLLVSRIKSAGKFVGTAIAFVMPFAAVLTISAWRRLLNIDKHLKKNDHFILLNRFFLVVIISVMVLTIFVSMPNFKMRWFHPLMMIFPLWMLARIERKELLSNTIMRWFTNITIGFTVLILSTRIAQVTIGPDLGTYGRLNIPIIETIEKLPTHLIKHSILITKDRFIGSHLLSHYQQRSIVIEGSLLREEKARTATQCLWLWDDNRSDTAPSVNNIIESGELVTMVANTKYTLFYALTLKQECD